MTSHVHVPEEVCMLGQFPGILTEQPSTAFTEDAVRVRVYFIEADLKIILPLIDEFYCDFSTRDNISYGKLVRFFIQKAS